MKLKTLNSILFVASILATASSPAHTQEVNGLGVKVSHVTSDMANRLHISPGGGVLVQDVRRGSLADDLGIAREDVILEINVQPVNNEEDFNRIQSALTTGQIVRLLVRPMGSDPDGQTIFMAGLYMNSATTFAATSHSSTPDRSISQSTDSEAEGWSTWKDGSPGETTVTHVRVRCVQDSSNNKKSRWQIQLLNTSLSHPAAFKDRGSKHTIPPGQIADLAPVESKNCSKPLDFKVDTWTADKPQWLHYMIHYKDASVTVRFYHPTNWNAVIMDAAAAYTGATTSPSQPASTDAAEPEPSPASTPSAQPQTNPSRTSPRNGTKPVYDPPVAGAGSTNTVASSAPARQPAPQQPQRPALQTQVGGMENLNVYSTGDACSTGVGGPEGATYWAQDFQYSVWTNEAARITVSVSLTNGSTVDRRLTSSGGNQTDRFTVRLGCDYYAPQKLGISHLQYDAQAQ
jgi:hypothetical protein